MREEITGLFPCSCGLCLRLHPWGRHLTLQTLGRRSESTSCAGGPVVGLLDSAGGRYQSGPRGGTGTALPQPYQDTGHWTCQVDDCLVCGGGHCSCVCCLQSQAGPQLCRDHGHTHLRCILHSCKPHSATGKQPLPLLTLYLMYFLPSNKI